MGELRKFIYWREDEPKKDGQVLAVVHLLEGYNQGTINDFQNMATELRKTFPQAKDDEIYAGKIRESSYVRSFSIIAWRGYLPKKDYPGWEESKQCEYFW